MSLIAILTLLALGCVQGQFFEDRRCRCVCPNPATVLNTTITRQIYTGNVRPSQCDCENVVVSQLRAELEGKAHLYCPRCECIYQTRNTTLIMAVVFLIVIVTIMSLLYMACFTGLKYLLFRGHNQRYFFRMPNRNLDRPPERDYIREHRGEFERTRRARQLELERQEVLQNQRDRNRPARGQPSDSEHENLLDNADPDN